MNHKFSRYGVLAAGLQKTLDLIGKDEAEQFAVRFLVAGIVILYTSLGEHPYEVQVFSTSLSLAQAFGFGYLFTLILTSLSAFVVKLNRPLVRIFMMFVDVVFFSASMAMIPESATPLFFVYLLIILGFGFRFGNKYLFAGMLMSLIGFSTSFSYSDYWHENRSFAFGYLFVLMIVSAYVSYFIRRLNMAKRKMEEAVAKADAANEAKSKFLANMSHELRTPLNGVITVSDLLSETRLSDAQKEYTDTIQSSAHTLLELINDVLDFSKIEAEKIILDNICFDLHACIADVVRIVRPLADKKKISIHNNISKNTPQFIYGDPIRLKQILINLANNAVKFTDHGHISIHTYSTDIRQESAHFCFEVIDTGIGISQEAQGRIFERFVQEDDSTTRRFGGTGLGISIAKQLVELMGGIMGVTSNPGKGSRFWFEIDSSIASSQEFESLDANVVIVSSNEKNIALWKKLLDSWNHKYVVRDTLDEALTVLDVWHHTKDKCSIMLDEDALHMSPVRAAQLIKSVGLKKIVIMLSTMNPMVVANPGVRMYFDAILDQPINSRQLYHALMGVSDFERQEGVVSLSSHIDQLSQKKAIPLHVLVAEDQATNQFVFRRILESQGHHVTLVDDGQQALDLLGVEKFDLTIVDLNMPNISGLEVIKMFKYMAPENDMPFIVVTANTSEEILIECRGLADAVLVKPIEKRQLLDVVCKAASNKAFISGRGEIQKTKFDDLPIMDVGSLDDMLGQDCDNKFLQELFAIFGKDAAKLINNIDNTVRDKQNLPLAKNHAHALKGIANNVSAMRLAALAKYCEEEIQANPDVTRQADQLITLMNSCLLATKDAMKNYLSSKHAQLLD